MWKVISFEKYRAPKKKPRLVCCMGISPWWCPWKHTVKTRIVQAVTCGKYNSVPTSPPLQSKPQNLKQREPGKLQIMKQHEHVEVNRAHKLNHRMGFYDHTINRRLEHYLLFTFKTAETGDILLVQHLWSLGGVPGCRSAVCPYAAFPNPRNQGIGQPRNFLATGRSKFWLRKSNNYTQFSLPPLGFCSPPTSQVYLNRRLCTTRCRFGLVFIPHIWLLDNQIPLVARETTHKCFFTIRANTNNCKWIL